MAFKRSLTSVQAIFLLAIQSHFYQDHFEILLDHFEYPPHSFHSATFAPWLI